VGPQTDDEERIDAEETIEEFPTIDQTRVQVEQTRVEMGETIDAIRERLNAQSLSERAKETMAEVTSNVAEKAKETVSHVMHEAKESVHDVVEEAKENLPSLTSNVAHQAVSGAVNEAKEAVSSAVDTARHAMGEAADTAKDASATLLDMVRRNPSPAALIAAGLGWLWASNRGHAPSYPRYDGNGGRYRLPHRETMVGSRFGEPLSSESCGKRNGGRLARC
jgi:ElaB/YqjD/DUF883 family membrane-anchored ribosome-binding protein